MDSTSEDDGADRGRLSDARLAEDHPRLAEIDPEAGRRARVRRAALRLAVAAVFLAGGVSALFGHGGIVERSRLHAERERLATQVAEAEARVAALERAIADMDGDPIARERIARERLGYTKPGEVVFLLADEPVAAD